MYCKEIYCGNCGKKGHVYRKCLMPITSLGIICVQFDGLVLNNILNLDNKIWYHPEKIDIMPEISNNLKFLLVRRKHSLGFIEFTRGNYKLNGKEDINYLINLFERMSRNEIDFIKNSNFDQIWNHLWINKESTISHIEEYNKAKNKFEALENGIKIGNGDIIMLKNITENVKTKYQEAEWGFPKGRRNIKENDLSCACREFMEETDFKRQEFILLNLKPINEIFTGSNQINYKHTYYISQSFNKNIPIISEQNFQQNIEISDIGWFTYSEAMEKIRSYNVEKKNMLSKVHLYIASTIQKSYFLQKKRY